MNRDLAKKNSSNKMNGIILKNCKNCLASKQEDSLVAGFCQPCISKAISLVNEYYAFIRDEKFAIFINERDRHEND